MDETRDARPADPARDDHPAGAPSPAPVADAVAALCAVSGIPGSHRRARTRLPSRARVAEAVESLRAILFPDHFGPWDLSPEGRRYFVGAGLDRASHLLDEQIRRVLALEDRSDPAVHHERAAALVRAFVARLPEVRRLLLTDVEAAYEGDPAARGVDEVILAYPGIMAVTWQRIAHVLYELGVPLLARIVTEEAHGRTGIDIHPGAEIGERFFIDHGTGVVIGETCVIGRGVRIYQGVTLGARSFPLDAEGHPVKGVPRHPIVEDDVVIYSGATILGRVTIGRGSSIGGNVWLTRSVPPGSTITQGRAREGRFDQGDGI